MKRSDAEVAAVVVAIVAIFLAVLYVSSPSGKEEFHIHADFRVYLDGEAFNFSQEKYMTEGRNALSELVHLHGLDGDVIHVHARGVSMGMFFESLGMHLNSTCLVLGNGSEYCSNGSASVRMYVNGARNYDYGNYEPKDLDRILITYGDVNSEVQQQVDSVTDKACISSGKCPERGEPPYEACSTEGGCPVE